MEFDNQKRKTVAVCPFCGKSNKDGKFVPYRDYPGRGHCHSCGKYSPIGKHTCPKCHLEKAFNRYIDTENGDRYLGNDVGKCLYCDYHYSPKHHFEDTKDNVSPTLLTKAIIMTSKTTWPAPQSESLFIDSKILTSTLKGYESNNFVTFLTQLFGEDIASELIGRYFIGTSKHWPGSTVFWQIDTKGRIRDGKIMLYDPISGKRIKEPFSHVTWVHSILELPKPNQCLFGEHLLSDKTKPIAIVESEKTAIISSIYLPHFLWLAVGGKDGLSIEKLSILKGRTVVLYPDVNAFDLWSEKAKQLSDKMPGTRFVVSDLLEKNASEEERSEGLDLADYLIRFDIKQFGTSPESQKVDYGPIPDNTPAIGSDHWLNSIRLLPSMSISDSLKFIDSLPFYP